MTARLSPSWPHIRIYRLSIVANDPLSWACARCKPERNETDQMECQGRADRFHSHEVRSVSLALAWSTCRARFLFLQALWWNESNMRTAAVHTMNWWAGKFDRQSEHEGKTIKTLKVICGINSNAPKYFWRAAATCTIWRSCRADGQRFCRESRSDPDLNCHWWHQHWPGTDYF